MPWGSGRASGYVFATASGFSSGGTSHGLSARTPGGVGALNLVTPTAVLRGEHSLLIGGRSRVVLSRVRLRFVPEPMAGLSLSAATLLLGLLGRRRAVPVHG